jgi:hypothetical protein
MLLGSFLRGLFSVRTFLGKRGRAEDKGKGEDNDLIGISKVVAISTSTWFAGLKTAIRFLSAPRSIKHY